MMINLRMISEKAPEGATHYTDGVPSLNVYVKVVHLDGFYLHLAGKWERYPAYAEMKSLDDLRRTLELQDERDALAAQNEALQSTAAKVVTGDAEISELEPLLDATPQQHLAEIRAEIESLKADNKSLSDAAQQLKNMIETFSANIPEIQADAAKAAIYALFEVGNCPQYENGAGDGYIECGDALKFAEKYAKRILSGEVK